jgi:hypothetical protein
MVHVTAPTGNRYIYRATRCFMVQHGALSLDPLLPECLDHPGSRHLEYRRSKPSCFSLSRRCNLLSCRGGPCHTRTPTLAPPLPWKLRRTFVELPWRKLGSKSGYIPMHQYTNAPVGEGDSIAGQRWRPTVTNPQTRSPPPLADQPAHRTSRNQPVASLRRETVCMFSRTIL